MKIDSLIKISSIKDNDFYNFSFDERVKYLKYLSINIVREKNIFFIETKNEKHRIEFKDSYVNINDFNFNIYKIDKIEDFIISSILDCYMSYEFNNHSHISPFFNIEKTDVVLDIGSGFGFFSKYIENSVSKIIMIEPSPFFNNLLKQNFNNEIYDLFLSSNIGYININDTHKDGYKIDGLKSDTKVEIKTTTIDSFFLDMKFNFIRMDVENSEINIIDGAKKYIEKYKPKLSIAIYHSFLNGYLIKEKLLSINPNYHIHFSGICERHGSNKISPMILYAW